MDQENPHTSLPKQPSAASLSNGRPPLDPPQADKTPPASQPIPRGPSRWIVIDFILVAAAMLVVGGIWGQQLYQGTLAMLNGTTKSAASEGWWTCGMHPYVHLPHPGLCPVCQMQLVPEKNSTSGNKVAIDPVVTQSIGVQTAVAKMGQPVGIVRTVGTVDYYEPLVRDVNIKVGGWVEKLYADSVGKDVHKDQPLLEVYSPELYAAQAEYLAAYKSAKDTGDPNAWNSQLLQAARKRLGNFDITPTQIEELQTTGQASKTMTIRSPYDGTVIVKNVYEGQKIEPGSQLLRLADMSRVWVMVVLYEHQLPFVQKGQAADVSLSYDSAQKFSGTVEYIYPYMTPELRQVRVRVELDNRSGVFKPGMFVNVELSRTLAESRVLIPRQAVIDTGRRQVVFLSLGDGRFERRDVKVGDESQGDQVAILEGVKVGDTVVTSAQFLLDSESNLREGAAKMNPATATSGPATTPTTLPTTAPGTAAYYTCTMHPEVRSDKPGNCPKCGMKLVKVTPASQPATEPANEHAH